MIMALDIGFRRVGVALTDISEQIVYPYATLNNRGVQKLLPQVLEICIIKEVKMTIIGLPLLSDGSWGEIARLSQRIHEDLSREGHKSVLWDETYSTREVYNFVQGKIKVRKAKNKGLVDQLAAARILESYLNSA